MPGRARSARRPPLAVIGPILGTQMLALLPLAKERGVPLLTISGTARLSEMGVPQFFRFFPSDATVKVAHARYVVEKLGAKRPAVIYQSTAYGQSGREQLAKTFAELKTPPVLEESVAPTVNDLTPALLRAKAANADVLVLQLHAASTVLAVRQARQLLPDLPIVAGSAMHQPATAALLEPAELKGVCAETAASPVSGTSRPMRDFLAAYRAAYKQRPRRLCRRAVRRRAHAGPRDRRPAREQAARSRPTRCASASATRRDGRAWSRPTGRTARATWRTRPRSSASTAPAACRGLGGTLQPEVTATSRPTDHGCAIPDILIGDGAQLRMPLAAFPLKLYGGQVMALRPWPRWLALLAFSAATAQARDHSARPTSSLPTRRRSQAIEHMSRVVARAHRRPPSHRNSTGRQGLARTSRSARFATACSTWRGSTSRCSTRGAGDDRAVAAVSSSARPRTCGACSTARSASEILAGMESRRLDRPLLLRHGRARPSTAARDRSGESKT